MEMTITTTVKCNETESRYLNKVAARNKCIEALKFLNSVEKDLFNNDYIHLESAKTKLRWVLDDLDEAIGE